MGLNAFRKQEMYVGPFSNPNAYHVAPLNATTGVTGPYQPGQAGQTFNYQGNAYTFVQLDTSATTPAVGQLLYWKSKTAYTVTNVVANAINGGTTNAWRNEIAGVCMVAAAAGEWIFMLINGANIPVACLATNGVGDLAISDVSGNVGNVLNIAVGTAPTYRTVGVFRTVSSGNLANVDVAIPELG